MKLNLLLKYIFFFYLLLNICIFVYLMITQSMWEKNNSHKKTIYQKFEYSMVVIIMFNYYLPAIIYYYLMKLIGISNDR